MAVSATNTADKNAHKKLIKPNYELTPYLHRFHANVSYFNPFI